MVQDYQLLTDKPGYGLAGDTVRLTRQQAEYLELGGVVRPVTPSAAPPAREADPAATGSGGRGRRAAGNVEAHKPPAPDGAAAVGGTEG